MKSSLQLWFRFPLFSSGNESVKDSDKDCFLCGTFVSGYKKWSIDLFIYLFIKQLELTESITSALSSNSNQFQHKASVLLSYFRTASPSSTDRSWVSWGSSSWSVINTSCCRCRLAVQCSASLSLLCADSLTEDKYLIPHINRPELSL